MASNIILITGCKSDIGLNLTRKFAENHHELVLVEPDEQELDALTDKVRPTCNVRAHVIARDLNQPEAAQERFDFADAAYNGWQKRLLIVVPGTRNKLRVMARRLVTEEAQSSMNLKMYQKIPPGGRDRARGDYEEGAES